jgi:hypothetical protein
MVPDLTPPDDEIKPLLYGVCVSLDKVIMYCGNEADKMKDEAK